MKPRINCLSSLAAAVFISFGANIVAPAARAGTLYFDGGTANIGTNGDGASAGLGGTWNTALTNWDQGNGLAHIAWDNTPDAGDTAVFANLGNSNQTVSASSVNAVDLVFSTGATTGTSTRWTLSGTVTLGDTVSKKASLDASAVVSGGSTSLNVTGVLSGDVSGGLSLTGGNVHGANTYSAYFNQLNPTRVNNLVLNNTMTFTGPVTIKNAVEIQGLTGAAGTRFKALGAATNDVILDDGTLFLYTSGGVFDHRIIVAGLDGNNALNLNNGNPAATVSADVAADSDKTLWSVAGVASSKLTYTGSLADFFGTLKVKGSATGSTVIATDTFGGTFEVDSGILQIGNNDATGTLGDNDIVNNGTILFNSTITLACNRAISGLAGKLTVNNSAGNLILGGNNTYEGATTVNAGTLTLDYSSSNNSKLSDTGVLNLNAGTLILTGGSHSELVGSTVVGGAATISRADGSATIDLGNITRAGSGTLDILGSGIARTLLSNDGTGKLPEWITVDGGPSMNDGSDNIVPFVVAPITDIVRLGGQVPDDRNAHVRIIDGGSFGNVTMAAAGTTTITNLTQSATEGAVVIDLGGGNTLRLGAILVEAAAGTLTVNNGTLTAGGADDRNGTLTVDTLEDAVFNVPIDDNGNGVVSLAKSGSATLTLNEANYFTGPVAISGGILEIAGAGQLGGGFFNASITNDATLRFNSTESQTLGGAISGTGALIKDNTGALALSGANTYTGETTVLNGTLSQSTAHPTGTITVGSGATYIAGTGDGSEKFAGGGKVVLRGKGNTVDARLMDSTGTVAVQVNGDWMNSNSGINWQSTVMIMEIPAGFSFDIGTNDLIQCAGLIGEGGISPRWGSGTNATLRFVGSDSFTFSGSIGYAPYTGGMHLVRTGTGTQTLTGNVWANNISISSGATLRFGTSNEATLQMDTGYTIANDGTLVFDWSSANAISNAISGAGNLLKDGSGTLTLSGTNTSTGTTEVKGGTLIVNGSQTASATTVKNTATLQGTGTLGTVGVETGGILAPGNQALGTLKAGNTVLAGSYVCEVNPSTSDKLEVNGTLDLTGSALVLSGTPTAATYTIATYTPGGLTGTFGGTVPGYTVNYATDGVITLVRDATGFSSWMEALVAAGYTGDTTPGGDSELDGMNNLLEYVLNGNPGVSDPAILPDLSLTATDLVFTFTRRVDSADDTTQVFEYGSDLIGWTPVNITGTPGVGVSIGIAYGTAPDQVQDITVTIPKSGATLFGRLKVSQ
ncbi:MAG: autotransporter-associated beta strand repeat-containing protein [Verrucomicrobia bacterium]|nr:autotransporter-associated beta strand repeat-containing protein [Verrucomicrobiota bacterium]